jgi:AbiJ N-terminal domain 4
MKFSERIGARQPPKSGLEEATPNLRTALWNRVYEELLPYGSAYAKVCQRNVKRIWEHLNLRADDAPIGVVSAHNNVGQIWQRVDWPEFFDLLELVAHLLTDAHPSGNRVVWFTRLNAVLEEQGCAYRFIAEQLAPVTNPVEVAEVAAAAECAIPSAAAHIREALRLLPPNANASPRNSIKESISAVEAALKSLTANPSATLTDGLTAFEGKFGALHPALRQGLIKLYGYTSDEKGVRHALVDEAANVTVSDARFMLVACSAFTNYLVALSSGNTTGVSAKRGKESRS